MFEKDVLKVIYVLQTISSITKVSVHPLPLCCNCRFLDARLDKMSHRADLLPGDYRSMLISHAVFYCSMPLSSSHVFFVVSHQFTVSAIRLLKKKKKNLGWLEHVLADCTELCARVRSMLKHGGNVGKVGRAPRFAISLQDLVRVLKRSPCKVVPRQAMWHWKGSKQCTRRSAHPKNTPATIALREMFGPCHGELRPSNLVSSHFSFLCRFAL